MVSEIELPELPLHVWKKEWKVFYATFANPEDNYIPSQDSAGIKLMENIEDSLVRGTVFVENFSCGSFVQARAQSRRGQHIVGLISIHGDVSSKHSHQLVIEKGWWCLPLRIQRDSDFHDQ
jgi:hypothetical protein